MNSNTTQNKKKYFSCLAKKIFLTPSNSVLEDCQNFLLSLEEDILALKNIDLSFFSIYYGREEFSFPSNTVISGFGSEENRDLLDSLIEDYEFTNIRIED